MNLRRAISLCIMFLCLPPVTTGLCPQVYAETMPKLHGWVVYWDEQDGWAELAEALSQKAPYEGVSYFAVSFREDGSFYVPKGMEQQPRSIVPTYMTVVNDVVRGQGNSLKDTAVLQHVLRDTKAQAAHSESLISLAKRYGYDGIEIDYEQVFKEKKLIPLYTSFLRILSEKVKAHHLSLRVVVEPKMARQIKDFPEGPTYVVMAYNLYGTHSGPGPKADMAFITKTIGDLKKMPKPWGIAFSTGGAMWSDKGEKKFITTPEALGLAKTYGVVPERDVFSKALSFSYRKDGVAYTVWYADEETMRQWVRKAEAQGIDDVSLWRLGEHEHAYTLTAGRKE